jgi:hypothetical protein
MTCSKKKEIMRRVTNFILIAGCLLFLEGNSLWADNPETDRSSANFDNKETGAVQHARDGANRALNDVDSGVHKAGRALKRGALNAKNKTNDGLKSMDKGLHKSGGEVKDSGNHGLEKVDDTVHDR